MKTKITRKTIEDKLNSYDFPHRFIVKYAVACAKLTNPTSKQDLTALDLAERFSNGEDISPKDLREASNAASNAAYAAYAAYYNAVNISYVAYNVAYNVFRTEDCSKVYDLLLNMINENFNELEILLLKRDNRGRNE